MKKILVIVFSILATTTFAQKNIEEATFAVKGNCGMCKNRIESALDIKGVKLANWDSKTGMLHVVFNTKKTNLETIHKAIANAGHDTDREKANEEVYKNLPDCCLYRDNYNPH
ncbi:MAG: heavy-metal-associated domain-containing protein [Bacteroidia bacterium]